jgi:hypothetical protein
MHSEIDAIERINDDGRTGILICAEDLYQQIFLREAEIFEVEFFPQRNRVRLCRVLCDNDNGPDWSVLGGLRLEHERLY